VTEVLRLSAFTTEPAGGNPAGVVLDAAGMTDDEMAKVAADVGYSETAFLTALDGRLRVRYFSPRAEVPFCGHATIAAGVALGERDGPGRYVFETPVGEVPVEVFWRDGLLVAALTSVGTRSRPATEDEAGPALAALRLADAALADDLPVHVAFGGNRHLIVPVASRPVLAALDYDYEALLAQMERFDWTTVHVTWRESPLRWHARDPFPVGGVVEDAATGAAAASFGGYLRALGLVPLPAQVTIIQGEDMGRRSVLTVDLAADDDRSRVSGPAVRL